MSLTARDAEVPEVFGGRDLGVAEDAVLYRVDDFAALDVEFVVRWPR